MSNNYKIKLEETSSIKTTNQYLKVEIENFDFNKKYIWHKNSNNVIINVSDNFSHLYFLSDGDFKIQIEDQDNNKGTLNIKYVNEEIDFIDSSIKIRPFNISDNFVKISWDYNKSNVSHFNVFRTLKNNENNILNNLIGIVPNNDDKLFTFTDYGLNKNTFYSYLVVANFVDRKNNFTKDNILNVKTISQDFSVEPGFKIVEPEEQYSLSAKSDNNNNVDWEFKVNNSNSKFVSKKDNFSSIKSGNKFISKDIVQASFKKNNSISKIITSDIL